MSSFFALNLQISRKLEVHFKKLNFLSTLRVLDRLQTPPWKEEIVTVARHMR